MHCTHNDMRAAIDRSQQELRATRAGGRDAGAIDRQSDDIAGAVDRLESYADRQRLDLEEDLIVRGLRDRATGVARRRARGWWRGCAARRRRPPRLPPNSVLRCQFDLLCARMWRVRPMPLVVLVHPHVGDGRRQGRGTQEQQDGEYGAHVRTA